MEFVRKQKLINHPMEDVFNLEPNSTLVEYKEPVVAPIETPNEYDTKDCEIETKIEEIYTAAMGQVSVLQDQVEIVEGKYKARISEVSATMLNVALGAVREKRELKKHKDGIKSNGNGGGTTNNNLVVADRNDLLKLLAAQQTPPKK